MNLMNLLRENFIFVFFGMCFLVSAMFWWQLSRIPDYGTFTRPTTTPDPSESKRVDQILALADRMIATTSSPRESALQTRETLLRRDPFRLPKPRVVVQTQVRRPKLPPLHVSSISWSSDLPLAVIDGRILGEGELVADTEVRIERIEPERIWVRYKGFQYRIEPTRE